MTARQPLMPVAEARNRILAAARAPESVEEVPLERAAGRILSAPVVARRTQPPVSVSAMDGYAVRAADLAAAPTRLRLAGESAAGHGSAVPVQPGEAVRIFTGAPLPPGADAILIQENSRREDGWIVATEPVSAGRHVRPAGHDFAAGDVGLSPGRRLRPADIALAAAMNYARLPVYRRPLIAILATGDELVVPGSDPGPDQIVCSNSYGVAAIVEQAGGVALDLGIARDTIEDLRRAIAAAQTASADLLITIGGASVGDYDLVQPALAEAGLTLDFWRVAIRPGKPLMHGRLGPMQVLGLPGNPVSAMVCAWIFAAPLVQALAGNARAEEPADDLAELGADMPANDGREDYVRAELVPRPGALPLAVPGTRQDSSLLRVLAGSDCLILRPPLAPPARRGDACRIVRLDTTAS